MTQARARLIVVAAVIGWLWVALALPLASTPGTAAGIFVLLLLADRCWNRDRTDVLCIGVGVVAGIILSLLLPSIQPHWAIEFLAGASWLLAWVV